MRDIHWSMLLSTAPTIEPVSRDEAKAHLRVDDAASDDYIDDQITIARRRYDGIEGILGRALITQTWLLYLDKFPAEGSPILLPLSPLQSVTSLAYVDSGGTSQTWAASEYQVDAKSEPPRIKPAYGEVYPVTRAVPNAVTITAKLGYGDTAATVPLDIRHRILIEVADLYEQRQSVIVGVAAVRSPIEADRLIHNYRVRMGA